MPCPYKTAHARHNAEQGYYIAAARALEANTVITQEAPLASCPPADAFATLCRRCFDPVPLRHTTPHHVCPRCAVAHYCSRYCRRADRDDHHYSGECCFLSNHSARYAAMQAFSHVLTCSCSAQLDDLVREACLALRLLHIDPPLHPPLAAHPHTLQDPAHIPTYVCGMSMSARIGCRRDAERLQAAARYMAAALQATHDGACRAPTPPSPSSGDDEPAHDTQDPAQQRANHPPHAVHAVSRHGRSTEALRDAAAHALAAVVANALELQPLLVHGEAVGGQAPAAVYRCVVVHGGHGEGR